MTIEDYLRELRQHLKVGPLAKRRILREVEDHLRSAVTDGAQQSLAVIRLGPPQALGDALTRANRPRTTRLLLVAAGVGAAAIGVLVGAGGSHGRARGLVVGSGSYAAGAQPVSQQPPETYVPVRSLVSTRVPRGVVRIFVARDAARLHYLGSEFRRSQMWDRSVDPNPLEHKNETGTGWSGGTAGFAGGLWSASVSQQRNVPFVLFERAGGTKPQEPEWVSVQGYARRGVARVAATFAGGTVTTLTLNRHRAFAWAGAPSAVPVSMTAYDAAGASLGTVEVPDLKTFCEIDGCGGPAAPPDGTIVFTDDGEAGSA